MKHVRLIYLVFLNRLQQTVHMRHKRRCLCIVPWDVMTCFVQLHRRWLITESQIEAMRSEVRVLSFSASDRSGRSPGTLPWTSRRIACECVRISFVSQTCWSFICISLPSSAEWDQGLFQSHDPDCFINRGRKLQSCSFLSLPVVLSIMAGGCCALFFAIYESVIFSMSSHIPSGVCCGVFAESQGFGEV